MSECIMTLPENFGFVDVSVNYTENHSSTFIVKQNSIVKNTEDGDSVNNKIIDHILSCIDDLSKVERVIIHKQ